jgi:hypothetical protein
VQADSLRDDLRSVAKFVADTYGDGGAKADAAQAALQQFATYVTLVDGALFQAKRSDTLSDEAGERAAEQPSSPCVLLVSARRASVRSILLRI